ncbi:AAA family ATPase [Candidatus Woesearchaeota archaeon]|nr:AAA family ATPase [Candidatus Woesearchaeota archaeon]
MDLKLHDSLREKVRTAYTEIPTQGIYYNSRGAIEFTYKNSGGEIKKIYLDPVTSSAIVNALVPKSGVIYRGGHGGGKTTLIEKVTHMLTSIPEDEILSAMIRGNDDQNVNTLLATLRLGKLMTTGEEEVLWRNFVKCPVKIIDEVNRFPPPAQNALFEIMNKGRIEFIDQVYEIPDFIAFATENPNDSGTYPLSKPFIDRFSFCVPAPQIPSAADLSLLAERLDDKLQNLKVTPVMTFDELTKTRKLISKDVRMSPDALVYAIYLTQAVSTCERADYFDKSHNEIPVGERCKGCGFDTSAAICKMTQTGISGRAFLDFQRWGKAYAWFVNAFTDPKNPQVQVETISTIAPYLMYHRVQPNEMILGKDPFYGAKLEFLEQLVDKATQSYNTVKDALKELPQVLRGDIAPEKSKINDISKDLVVKRHFQPLIEEAGKKEFRTLFDEIDSMEMTQANFQKFQRKLMLESELKPHAQKYLLSKIQSKQQEEDNV